MTSHGGKVPRSFGMFKPVGYVLASFADDQVARNAANSFVAAGFDANDVHFAPAAEVVEHAGDDVAHVGILATIGQDLNLVRAHLALARRGHGFVAVRASDAAEAERVADIARGFGADRAQRYGQFITEELIEPGTGEAQVAESPDRGLDLQIRAEPLEPVVTDDIVPRTGSRPATTPKNPHEQLEQNAPAALQEALWERMRMLPGTAARSSAIAPPGSRALWLEDGTRSAMLFMIGREFVHLHPRHDGSLHLVLDGESCAAAKEAGWAERHPLAGQFAPANTVMVYGPRDDGELEVVWDLVRRSHAYATGAFPAAEADGAKSVG